MCGITGFLSEPARPRDALLRTATAMADSLLHRGPDDFGVWADEAAGVALGFRRLSIIDLSEHGHQPMVSASGRYVMVFNGEMYNFPDLRERLIRNGHGPLRGHSDTEVALGIFEEVGFERALEDFNGMFALAVWDRQERRLSIARDRFGEKPLYYGWCGRTFLYGSELKSLRAHPDFNADIDRDSIAEYFRFGYVPCPRSIYRGIRKLPPGCSLTIASAQAGAYPDPRPYWSARAVAEAGLQAPYTGSEDDAVGELDALLRDAVRMRMLADVPLGAFLSGGIDSSTIVSLMQAQNARPVRTFTIGNTEAGYDEARDAKAVAAHLGTDHTELYVTPDEARAVIPRLPALYDEPFADSSQIPTFLVSSLARQHVTVALSGDAGDELFGGYNRYGWGARMWTGLQRLPAPLRRAAGRSLRGVSAASWDRMFQTVTPLVPRAWRVRSPGEKLHKLGAIAAVGKPSALYEILVSTWEDPSAVVLGASAGARAPHAAHADAAFPDPRLWMMYHDTVTYLPDDILAKVDRASMGTSLEARVPLLDPRVYAFAWRLPIEMKIRGGTGKHILRRVLQQYVPAGFFERPKMGFAVPIGSWIRGPMRDWAAALLDPRRLRDEGFLAAAPIESIWKAHAAGSGNWQYHLWVALMFQAWLEERSRGSAHAAA
jgi:asparagine synthase (glutamine-hydrolysing)